MADMTLEEALAVATVDEELVTPVNEVLLINPETRSIHVPDSEKLFGVRQDMSVERKYFKCPRIVGDNIDLFEHYVFVNYIPSDQNGKYESEKDVQGYWCKDLAVEGDFITFSWELTENVLRKAGYIAFAVYAKVSDEYGNLKTKWHTTIAIGNVLDTLPDGEEWITVYPDIVTQLLERMDEVEKIANPESMQRYVDDYFNRNPMMIDRELKDATKAAPADIVGKLSEDIATKASAIKEKASGEVIVATDSDEQKPLGLAIDGKSEQNQYSGKNLFDTNKIRNYYLNKNDGTISNNELWRLSDFISAIPLSSYILSQTTNVFFQFNVCFYDKDKKFISGLSKEANGIKFWEFTTPENAEFIRFAYSTNVANNPVDRGNVMLRLSGTDDTYEKYVGGQPSPNPSYPQEIRNIGVYDEASGKYAVEVKCVGKNLLENKGTPKQEVGITYTPVYDENGLLEYIEANGTAIADSRFRLGTINPKTFGKRVILTGCPKDGRAKGCSFYINGVLSSYVDYGDGVVIDVPSDCDETCTYTIIIASGYTATNLRFYPMLRLAEVTDDTYEPYKETTATVYLDEPLRKGDKVYWNGGSKVRVDRYSISKVLNGSESDLGVYVDDIGARFYVYRDGININLCENVISVSDSFICNTTGIISNKPNVMNVRRYKDKFTFDFNFELGYITDNSIENFKLYLSGKPIKVEYPLSTPITEEIDIDLGELSMFYPTTILSNDCNANMEVTYIADTKAYIDKKFAELATAMV